MDEAVIELRHNFYVLDGKGEYIATIVAYERHGVYWLSDLWVHVDHRKKGLGKKLFEAALEEYGDRDLYLNVHGYQNRPISDEQLAQFYGRYGFKPEQVPGVMRRRAR